MFICSISKYIKCVSVWKTGLTASFDFCVLLFVPRWMCHDIGVHSGWNDPAAFGHCTEILLEWWCWYNLIQCTMALASSISCRPEICRDQRQRIHLASATWKRTHEAENHCISIYTSICIIHIIMHDYTDIQHHTTACEKMFQRFHKPPPRIPDRGLPWGVCPHLRNGHPSARWEPSHVWWCITPWIL